MGCFHDLPGERFHGPSGLKLKRCPRHYIEKLDHGAWIEAVFFIRKAFNTGNMQAVCPSPSLATVQAIQLVEQNFDLRDKEFQASLAGMELKK